MAKSPKDTGGPVVKSGPTRGENRSRNNDGTWRAKRSDAGKSRPSKGSSSSSSGGKKKGCFLTTAACELRGLPDDCAELMALRRFRDEVLTHTPEGRELIAEYYENAPQLVPLVRTPGEKDKVWADIQKTVSLVNAGRNAEAVSVYRAMYERLSIQA